MSPDPPYKIIIVGHSYVHWLCSFVEMPYHGSGLADFVVDGCRCDVIYIYIYIHCILLLLLLLLFIKASVAEE